MCLSGGRRVSSSGDWDSGNPAFAISHGSRNASPLTPSHDRCFADMLLFPFTFRIWVSHWTQEPSFEFLPAAPGIQQSASRRNSLLGHPMPAEELGPPDGRLTGPEAAGPRRGYRVPHARATSGVGALSTRGRRCSSRPSRLLARRMPLCCGQSLHPAPASHRAGLSLTRHQRGFKQFARPLCPSPVAPGWSGSPWAFHSSFAPHRCRRRTSRGGQAVEHEPGTTLYDISHASNLACSLNACDLASHDDEEH